MHVNILTQFSLAIQIVPGFKKTISKKARSKTWK